MTNEEFYDAEIAPALKAVMTKCSERGLPFLATVQYAPGEWGTTVHQPEGTDFWLKCAYAWIRTRGNNIDSFVIWLARQIRMAGTDHSSIVLERMGVEPVAKDRKP